ncbi:PepSY domain-containing protein [Bacillus sp. SM2101]|uniref:PepSY domain-containing protein n=1 Tax=Bacillus sp. SM2101 TaxID=2805366 RepID=UPI001BDE812C|nr:PepSY domain-containing protein [Bacillus sp. SM2101]
MGWKKFILGIGIGLAGAYVVQNSMSNTLLSPEKALKIVKDAFKENGSINGSWINMSPKSIKKDHINYRVYEGGISRNEDGQSTQYTFIVDAQTGTILEVV